MKARSPSLCGIAAVVLLTVLAGLPVAARFGQEAGPPIVASDMEGRRLPSGGPECPWSAGSAVVGYGEMAQCRIMYMEDKDIFYDPYDVWDEIGRTWEIIYTNGETEIAGFEEFCSAYQEPDGRVWGACVVEFCPLKRGTYTVKCTMWNPRKPGDPALDAPIVRAMTIDAQCSFQDNPGLLYRRDKH